MKKGIFITVMIVLTIIMGTVIMEVSRGAQTATYTNKGPYRNAKTQMITCTFDNVWPYTNMNNLTLTVGHVQGDVTRLGYDATGTDTQYDIVLKDALGFTIFTKTDCNTTLGDLSYTVFQDDTGGDPHRGVPVSGYLSLDIDDVAQQDEVQTITAKVDADAGTYTITIDGEVTSALAFDTNTALMLAALEGFDCIGGSGMTSVVSTLDAANTTPIVLTFADSLGNVPAATVALTDTNCVNVGIVETTEGGNLLTGLLVYIWYEQ